MEIHSSLLKHQGPYLIGHFSTGSKCQLEGLDPLILSYLLIDQVRHIVYVGAIIKPLVGVQIGDPSSRH
jgi:hypothetical protein